MSAWRAAKVWSAAWAPSPTPPAAPTSSSLTSVAWRRKSGQKPTRVSRQARAAAVEEEASRAREGAGVGAEKLAAMAEREEELLPAKEAAQG